MASVVQAGEKWRAQLCVGGRRVSRTFRSHKEARAWAAAEEIRIAATTSAPLPPAEQHTVREMLERYQEAICAKKRGARQEALRIQAFLRDSGLGDRTLASIDTPDLAAWRDARRTSPGATQRNINVLRAAWNVAVREWKWCDRNPFTGLTMPGQNPPRDRRITPGEIRLLVRWMGYKTGQAPQNKTQEVALAFLLSLRTAMRAGEILSLGPDCVDLDRRVATVRHKMQYKTGAPRRVPLHRGAVRLLRAVADRERFFTISSASLDALFRKVRDKLMIADLHFHDARAAALTRMSRKVDVLTLAKISGHKDLRVLNEHYYRESEESIAARL